MSTWLRTWFGQHGAETLIGGLFSVLAFFGVRGVGRIDKSIDDHDERLRKLESSVVTRKDFDEMRGSLTASITNVGMRLEDRLSEQNQMRDDQTRELRKDQRSLVERVDRLIEMKGGA